ncbi:hypothetical protein C0J52_24420 [Blattella germanica]|nr:hypothetical protein C0J52_24420 [Blattella germanica]
MLIWVSQNAITHESRSALARDFVSKVMYCRALTFVTLFYVTQGLDRSKRGTIPVITKSYGQDNTTRHVSANIPWRENINDGSDAPVRRKTRDISSEMAVSKELITDMISKRYDDEIKLKEKKTLELGSRAKHHAQFSHQYRKISNIFQEKSKDKKLNSEKELRKSEMHEKESSIYAKKAKEIAQKAVDQENNEIGFINKYRKGYWKSTIAHIKTVAAVAQMKIQELRAKHEFIKSTELEKLANLILSEAQDYDTMAKIAEENAHKEKVLSEKKGETARNHHAKAEELFFKAVVNYRRQAKQEYSKYLEYIFKAEKENELAREELLRAELEMKLLNAFLQKSQHHSYFAKIAKSRYDEDIAKAKLTAAGIHRPRDAGFVLSSKTIEEKSLKMVSD